MHAPEIYGGLAKLPLMLVMYELLYTNVLCEWHYLSMPMPMPVYQTSGSYREKKPLEFKAIP